MFFISLGVMPIITQHLINVYTTHTYFYITMFFLYKRHFSITTLFPFCTLYANVFIYY